MANSFLLCSARLKTFTTDILPDLAQQNFQDERITTRLCNIQSQIVESQNTYTYYLGTYIKFSFSFTVRALNSLSVSLGNGNLFLLDQDGQEQIAKTYRQYISLTTKPLPKCTNKLIKFLGVRNQYQLVHHWFVIDTLY